MAKRYAFAPDYAVAPGATLKETLEAKGMSQADLAIRTGITEKTISQIINGIAPITYETSEKLEFATGVPATFWNRRELSYREAIARNEESARLATEVEWLKELPIKDLIERNYVEASNDKAALVRNALKFFAVSSVEAWRNTWADPATQFRGKASQEKRPGYVAAWLRIGELQASNIEVEAFDATEFQRGLQEIRQLTGESIKIWIPRAIELCRAAGVALVFTKEIAKAGVSGATKWLTKDKALIQLSLKYKTDDQLIFTFFHEAGHILLHGKKQVFVEFGPNAESEEEREADAFARDILIPPEHRHRLPYLKNRSLIQQFAKSLGISPGVVVGRLQHDGLCYPSAFNDLKKKLTWANDG